MTDHQPTIRTPMPIGPCVSLTPAGDPAFVVLEWRYAEVVRREVLHRGDLVAALAPAPSAEDREALAEAIWRGAGRGRPDASRITIPADYLPEADAALAWFAARQPAPTVSAEDIQEQIELAIPDDIPGWRQRYTDKAVANVARSLAAQGIEVRDV